MMLVTFIAKRVLRLVIRRATKAVVEGDRRPFLNWLRKHKMANEILEEIIAPKNPVNQIASRINSR